MAVRMAEVEPVQIELTFVEKQDQLYSEIRQELRNVVEQQTEKLKLLIEQASSLQEEEDQGSDDLAVYKETVNRHFSKFIQEAISRAFFSMASSVTTSQVESTPQACKAPTISVSSQTASCQPVVQEAFHSNNEVAVIQRIKEEQALERQMHAGQSRLTTDLISRLVAQTSAVLEGYVRVVAQEEVELHPAQGSDQAQPGSLLDDDEVRQLVQNFEQVCQALQEERAHRVENQQEIQILVSAVQQAAEYIQNQKSQLTQLLEERSLCQFQTQRLSQAIAIHTQEKDLLKEVCYLLLQQTTDIKEESGALLVKLSECQSEQAQTVHQSNHYLEYLSQVLGLVRDRVSKSHEDNGRLIESLKRDSATASALMLQGAARYENMLTRYNQERDEWDQFKTDLDSYVKELEAALSDTKASHELLESDRDSLSQELAVSLSKLNDQDSLVQSYQHQWTQIWGWIANQVSNGAYPEDSILEALEFAKSSIHIVVVEQERSSHKLEIEQLISSQEGQLKVLEEQLAALQAQLSDLSVKHQAEIAILQSDHQQQLQALETAHAEAQSTKLTEKQSVEQEDISLELASLKEQNAALNREIDTLHTQLSTKDALVVEVRQQLQEQHDMLSAELKRYAETNKELEQKYELLGEEVKTLAQTKLQTDETPVESHADELAALQEQADTHLKALAKSEELVQEKVSELEGALQDKLIFESQLSLLQTERDELLQKVKDLEAQISERPAAVQEPAETVTPPKAEVEDKETQSDPEVIESDPEEQAEKKDDKAIEPPKDDLVEELRRQLQEAQERIAALESAALNLTEPDKGSSEPQIDSKPASRSADDPEEFIRVGGDGTTTPQEVDNTVSVLKERVEEQENRINLLLLDLQEAGMAITQMKADQQALTEKFVAELRLAAQTNGTTAREFLKSLPKPN